MRERRFGDAGYYYYLLAGETLKLVSAQANAQMLSAADRAHVRRFAELELKAELYHAYHIIYRYTVEPFVTSQPETIFQARFPLQSSNF